MPAPSTEKTLSPKLRIAVWHNLPSGGGKRALFYHVKGLIERGHYVEAWCPSTADQQYLPLSEIITEHVVPFTARRNGQYCGHTIPPAHAIRERLRAMEETCQTCAHMMTKKNFDVLFSNACLFFRTSPITRMVHIPSVLYLGEPYRWFYEALPHLPWKAEPNNTNVSSLLEAILQRKRRRKGLEALMEQVREEYNNAKTTDLILVNSLFSRESVIRAYGLDAEVCYLGIDTTLFNPMTQNKKRYVVGMGSISEGKRIDRAIRALATIPITKRPPLIWIANMEAPTYRRHMEELAEHLQVSISFHVAIPDNELVRLLSNASCMLYVPQLEPFGFAPLEANACGTPVVALAEGGVRESVHNGVNGYIIESNQPTLLGEKILELISDPEKAVKMGKAARSYVEHHWTWEKAINALEQKLYNAISQKIVFTQ